MHPLRGERAKRKSLDFSRLFRVGGRNRTRTCDPIDVNDVLSRTGRFFKPQTNGTRCRKPLKIGLFRRIPFPSPGYTEGYTQGYMDFSCTLRRVPYTNRGTRPVNVENKGFGGCKGTRRVHEGYTKLSLPGVHEKRHWGLAPRCLFYLSISPFHTCETKLKKLEKFSFSGYNESCRYVARL